MKLTGRNRPQTITLNIILNQDAHARSIHLIFVLKIQFSTQAPQSTEEFDQFDIRLPLAVRPYQRLF